MNNKKKQDRQRRLQAKRKEKLLKRGGRQRFFDYSMKQKLIFSGSFLGISLVCLYIYNTIYMLTIGFLNLQASEKNPLKIFIRALNEQPLAAIVILLIGLIGAKLVMRMVGASRRKDPRGFKIKENSPEGSSRMMDEEEKRAVFDLLSADSPSGIILGKDKGTDELITLPWTPHNMDEALSNFNIALFGPPGTRKTTGFLLPNIYSFLSSMMSVVVTDPKGEIYRETLAAATYLGYNIKVLNLMPGQFRFSDGWDVLRLIRESPSPQDAADLAATIIMENSGGASGDSFWYSANINCLKFCLLFVAKGKGFVAATPPNSKGETRTLEAVYELITSPDMAQRVEASIEANPEDRKLLAQAFYIWKKHREAESIQSGLGMRLSILQNPDLIRVLSEDEIHFQDLNDTPTIIYLICSDQDTTYKSIMTLFTSFLFKEVADIADRNGEGGLARRLMMVFEEFGNIGKIPDLEKKVATLRSRKVGMIFCYQNIGQIMDTYGEVADGRHKWETILGGCATQLCLSANDATGQKYFSDLTGKMAVEVFSSAQQVATFAPNALKWNASERLQKMERGIPVMRPDDIKKIKANEILICPAQHNATLENKYYFWEHPLYNIRMVNKDGKIVSVHQNKHIPQWQMKELFEKNREIMRYSPMTAKQMLDDGSQPQYVEGYSKKKKNEEMHLPWYLKLLSNFFEFEEEDADEQVSGDLEQRLESENTYASFCRTQENDYEIFSPVDFSSESLGADHPLTQNANFDLQDLQDTQDDIDHAAQYPSKMEEDADVVQCKMETDDEEPLQFTDAVFQDIDFY